MKMNRKLLAAAAAATLVLGGGGVFAATSAGDSAPPQEGQQTTNSSDYDQVTIERTVVEDGVETRTLTTMSWQEFESRYGFSSGTDDDGRVTIAQNDVGESIIPTPNPPFSSGYHPGDQAHLFRYGQVGAQWYERQTVYRFEGGLDWTRTSNNFGPRNGPPLGACKAPCLSLEQP